MPQNAGVSKINLEAITDDVAMAARSPEMARHVALDHTPHLIARIRELEASTRVIHDKMKLEAEEMKRLLDGPGFSPKAYDETHGRFKAYFDAWTELDRHSRVVR
ncbi:hypothetical protein HOV03_gp44 [Gordonia phage Asapag]|uniref:Uncharacterized protein n=2 Tax=Langleyhallvirinae TaxID=2732613 RepID=A0A385DYZ2_9CAUD|nr:hypothetical protein HOT94_gp048 [Gordonia phage Phistory]YP_009819089.1 hypothetical protein HOV03_gp44 [Gordonia phage Asapag]AXQ64753.1 hypothetical protein SEA_PHISTORY_48 [Gordonia phage Phistory]QAU07193.1 hypothetical protein SEA_ASAPAG_44 [Gordonia phage Asapag]UTN91508.1 hypothetical protein SEA_PERIWINKLE_54 [Gordonia phage Periwinkle]